MQDIGFVGMATSPAAGSRSTGDGELAAARHSNASEADVSNGAIVERRVLRDGVHDAILEMLLDGRVSPGESLAIDGLAREFGVSPTPVREALGQLEHTGLVTREALKGYRVAPPLTLTRMGELIDARAILEVAAIRDAVPVTAEVLTELESVSSQHRRAASHVRQMAERHPGKLDWPTLRKYYSIDWDFHLIFLRNCHNGYLLQMAENLAPHVHRLRQSMHHGAIDVEQAVAEHALILDAVRTGEPEAAATAMADHIAAVRARALADG
jgi:DNA-binding GntR family transcriptional regulator